MITITKDKIYYSPFSLKDIGEDSDAVKELEIGDVIFMLSEEIAMGPDTTFRNVFDMILYHKDLLNVLYSKELKGGLIDDFIDDYENDFDASLSNDTYRLMVSWDFEVFEFDNKVECIDYVSFSGIGKLNVSGVDEEYINSLSLTPLSEMKDKRIFLNNSIEIHNDDTLQANGAPLFRANYRRITLYDLFLSIIHEISFYGGPSEREKQKKEIESMSEELDAFIESNMNEDGYIDWENIEQGEVLGDDFDGVINKSFWDKLYPPGTDDGEVVDNFDSLILAVSEGSGLTLEEQLSEAHDNEEYEKADKILKLIKKRDRKHGK